jgi:hypothetical protein
MFCLNVLHFRFQSLGLFIPLAPDAAWIKGESQEESNEEEGV